MSMLMGCVSHQARLSYLGLYSIRRSFVTSTISSSSSPQHPSDPAGSSYTRGYVTGAPVSGPIGEAGSYGVPSITPKDLGQYLSRFVVGQERTKRRLCAEVYSHYNRIRELRRRSAEADSSFGQTQQDAAQRHAAESEYAGQPSAGRGKRQQMPYSWPRSNSPFPQDSPVIVEKSNILILGPTGVGKTLMTKTLAGILDVPFSMSDCNAFTQAGYIGDDAEQCVHRLLTAANYDVAQAEQGIICLDEIDKIATAKVSQGRDVSGEGVQQALLKIIEGTTIQITAKQEKGAGSRQMNPGGYPGAGGMGNMSAGSGSKTEQYSVRTDNILFILTGAFIGLSKIIEDRVATGGMGFGQPVRAASRHGGEQSLARAPHLFRKRLPFFAPNAAARDFHILDLVEADDLKKYGLIPELVGRIGVLTAVGPLDQEALVRVLTEPQNALLRQFVQRFRYSDIELQFTSAALREIARAALEMGTGARGLRAVLMRLLADAMYETPGSSTMYILVNEAVAKMEQAPIYFSRGQKHQFRSMIAAEEEEWERRQASESGGADAIPTSPEPFVERAQASGVA